MGAKLPVLTAEQISEVVDLSESEMDVPEWKSSVKLRAFTIDERDKVLSQCTEKNGTTVDERGKVLSQCTEKDGTTVDAKKLIRLLVVHGMVEPKLTMEIVSRKSFHVIERIAKEVMRLNGMLKDEGASAATVADVTFRPES
jgi:hypothetical protein